MGLSCEDLILDRITSIDGFALRFQFKRLSGDSIGAFQFAAVRTLNRLGEFPVLRKAKLYTGVVSDWGAVPIFRCYAFSGPLPDQGIA